MKSFMKFCDPAKWYFCIALLLAAFALFNGMPVINIGIRLLFAFLWAFLLDRLCMSGYSQLSWAILLLPFLLEAIAIATNPAPAAANTNA